MIPKPINGHLFYNKNFSCNQFDLVWHLIELLNMKKKTLTRVLFIDELKMNELYKTKWQRNDVEEESWK